MYEVLLDLLNPPSWYALYISVLLGVGVNIVWSLVNEHSFAYSLSHFLKDYFSHFELEIKRLNIFTLHDWIANFIRRKESPGDEIGDHRSFSVI